MELGFGIILCVFTLIAYYEGKLFKLKVFAEAQYRKGFVSGKKVGYTDKEFQDKRVRVSLDDSLDYHIKTYHKDCPQCDVTFGITTKKLKKKER